MTNELKDRIKDFISSCNQNLVYPLNDAKFGLADYDLFLETAINLLEETINEV